MPTGLPALAQAVDELAAVDHDVEFDFAVSKKLPALRQVLHERQR